MQEYREVPNKIGPEGDIKTYKLRWLILALFVLYSMSNAMQWIQYSIIANVIVDHYVIASAWVDWTSMVYMVSYAILIVPGSYALDKFGLRLCVLAGCLGTCLGSWIKVFSSSTSGFAVGFVGQTVVAVSQVFVLSVPARLAAVWFGPNEVSSACSIGVFGNQLGIAAGFLIPPIMVQNSGDPSIVSSELKVMFLSVAIFTSALTILIFFFFKESPPLPPSQAQAALKVKPVIDEKVPIEDAATGDGFKDSMGRLLKNKGYLLLLLSYGINVGVFYAISTLLNQVILSYFPGREEDAGRIGVTMVLAGMVGSVISGIALDKTHKFKETTLVVYVFSLIGMVIYTFTLSCGYIAVVYTTIGFLGFFMTGYLPVGFELAAELTYPEPEGTSAGLLNGVVQVFGILFTNFYSFMFSSLGDFWANISLSVALLIGSLVTAVIPSDLRRQAAQNQPTN